MTKIDPKATSTAGATKDSGAKKNEKGLDSLHFSRRTHGACPVFALTSGRREMAFAKRAKEHERNPVGDFNPVLFGTNSCFETASFGPSPGYFGPQSVQINGRTYEEVPGTGACVDTGRRR